MRAMTKVNAACAAVSSSMRSTGQPAQAISMIFRRTSLLSSFPALR